MCTLPSITWHYNTGGMHTIMLHIHKMQYVIVHTHTCYVYTYYFTIFRTCVNDGDFYFVFIDDDPVREAEREVCEKVKDNSK